MRPVRVLIVDDQEGFRGRLRSLVSSRSDYVVCGEAADGREAIELVTALHPHIVLMDISMPGMNGLDATKILRRDFPDCQVVIVSQNAACLARVQAGEVGAAGYVEKNDLYQSLLATLDGLIADRLAETKDKPAKNAFSSSGPAWLAGGGVLGQLIREKDWSQTSLGAIESWPHNLRIAVNLMLNSRHPMWVGWGWEMPFLYNDAYISVLGLAKHSSALGVPTREVWPEIWDICGPLAEKVFEKGEATFIDDVRFFMNRGDFLEETYISFSYNPIYDDAGKVAGLFCPNTDTTPKILNARRLRTLSELAAKALVERSTEAACASSFATFAKNPDDIPFALLYLLEGDGRHAYLEQGAGISKDLERLSPPHLDLEMKSMESAFWHLNEVVDSARAEIVSLGQLNSVPLGPAGQRVSEAIVLPVSSGRQDSPIGIVIAGINPTRRLDSEYRMFYELLAGQVATAIQNARAAEEDRKRAEALAELDRAKTAFFSNVSHEFRTPLTLMLGPVEDLLARSHTDLSPAAKSQLELVNRNGSRLLRLVNTLLDFSRIEAGRMQAVYQPTDISAFTIELASVFRSATEKAGLRLELDCPQLSEPVFVDRDMWEKIVLNLISNAFKFTFEGEIAVSIVQAGNKVELHVRDTGVGIPKSELSRLFDRFHRVKETRSRTHEGSGIGLALVQELVKLHGGLVAVESKIGEGSTFIVSVPLGSDHLPHDKIARTRTLASTAVGAVPFVEEALRWLPNAESSDPRTELPSDFELVAVPCPAGAQEDPSADRRPRVLIADDNADMRQYLVRLLAERYNVKSVPNGQAALESVRESAPDLILTDVMMPELDGFGLLHALRVDSHSNTIPIILLSARAGEEARVEGMEHGADDYLIKPFSARELLARVQTHLELARVRKEAAEDLRQRNAQFETLLNAAPLGVYLVDADFRIQQMNPTAHRAFGDIPNLIGRDFDEVIHILWPKDYADEIVRQFRHTLESGEPYFVPERAEDRADSGAREVYEWQINRIPLPGGRYGVVNYFRNISARAQHREALRESENRLRHFAAIVDSSDDAIISKNLDGVIGSWNKGAERMFGYSAMEAIGRHITFIIPPDRHDEERVILERLKRGERLDHFETVRMRKDGTLLDISVTISPVKDATGRVIGASKVARDISERKRADRALRDSEERFRAIVETTPECVKLVGADGTLLHMNSSGLTMIGADCAEMAIGRNVYELIAAKDRDAFRAFNERICRGERGSLEFDIVGLKGTCRSMETHAAPFQSPDGMLVQLAVTRDVTERKQVEERERQLKEAAFAATAKFRAVFEQTTVFAGIMTLDGIMIDANRLCLEACGYRAEDVLGKYYWETGWWRNSKEVQTKIRAATAMAARGIPYRDIFQYHWADGTARLVEFALHPIQDEEGKVIFLHPTGVDITDLKQAEENYRKLAETLETQVRLRTEELEQRNREVLNQSEQLRELSRHLIQTQDNERRHIARELHDSAGQVLAALGMNLATIAQYAGHGSPKLVEAAKEGQGLVRELNQEIRTMSYLLHPPLLDESGLSEALRWYIRGLKERSGLDISLTIPEDFGRVSRDMELVIFRIIQECLTNIHRHSGSKVAWIRLDRDDQSVSLEVRDEGRGIPQAKLVEIQSHGTGVGIRGMRERVLQCGGKMSIQSDGDGTKVSIHFPAVRTEDLNSILSEAVSRQQAAG